VLPFLLALLIVHTQASQIQLVTFVQQEIAEMSEGLMEVVDFGDGLL
jgi:hypothetical protein